jgi:polysaccharide pyruvyl transferase WcaK-like protein
VVVLAGYSPFRHVGDDAIVRAHLQQIALDAPRVEAVLLARDPAPIAFRFKHRTEPDVAAILYDGIDEQGRVDDIRPFVRARIDELVDDARQFGAGALPSDDRRRAFFELVAGSEALLCASAGAVASRFAVAALWPTFATALVAHALGVPVLFSGITAGPFDRADTDLAARVFAAATLIVVRDTDRSAAVLRALGVPGEAIVEQADPAAGTVPAPPDEIDDAIAATGLPAQSSFVAVSLRTERGVFADVGPLAAVLDDLARRHDFDVLLIVHCVNAPDDDDREPLEKLAGELGPHVRVHRLELLFPDDVIAGVTARAALAIGSRYHSVVFAAAAAVPAIGLFDDDYTEQKMRGAAAFARGSVAVVPATAGIDELAAAADEVLHARAPAPPAHAAPVELYAVRAIARGSA